MSHSVEGDIQRLSEYFPAESFDAIFSIESLRHLPSFESIYIQLHELLKPGGKVRSVSPFIILCLISSHYVQLAIYEWCWTDILNPRNIEHQRLTEVIESSTMIGRRQPFQRSMECATRPLSQAHFHVLECLDRAGKFIVTPTNTIGWYAPSKQQSATLEQNGASQGNLQEHLVALARRLQLALYIQDNTW